SLKPRRVRWWGRHPRRRGRQSARRIGKQPRDATRAEAHVLITPASSRSIGKMNAVFPPWPIREFRDRSDGIPESEREDSIFRGAGAFLGRTKERMTRRTR